MYKCHVRFYGMMHHTVIPIVIDLHGHHEKSAPPHSYINAMNFATVKKLADYLTLLDQNDTLYNVSIPRNAQRFAYIEKKIISF